MPHVVSFVGTSDSGKTTLVSKLIAELKARKVKVGVIKHAHHGFDLDREGSDSDIYRKAGADGVMLASPQGMALMQPSPTDSELDSLISFFPDMDLVITEGFKREKFPKIEVYRSDRDTPPLAPRLDNLIAVVTDTRIGWTDLPVFDPGDIPGLADFIEQRFLA